MKSMRNYNPLSVLVLVILAVGLSASLASAQEYEGKFTLPFTAHWGQAVLPPGDYTLKFDNPSAPRVAKVEGANSTVMIVANGGMRAEKVAGPSALVAVRNAGKYRVRFLRLAEVGLVFEYAPPEAERQILAQGPVLIRRVPVTMTGR